MSKRTTNQVSSVNIKEVSATDRLHGSVRFRYTLDYKPVEHTVQLMQTDCNYGGVRHWFRCEYCHGHVGVLYLSGGQCACRKCFKLAYKTERESRTSRLFRKVDKIRGRLGWSAGIALPDGAKPKGMHWETFYRLKAEHDATAQCIFERTDKWCAKMVSRIERDRHCEH